MKFDVGIDIGTTNTKICFRDSDHVIVMPSVIAVKKESGRIVGIGEQAYRMIGKTPDSILVKKTVEKGVVSDYSLNKLLIGEVLFRKFGNMFRKPRICLCYHSFMTKLEKLTFKNSILKQHSNKLFFINESSASILGLDIDFTDGKCFLSVNVGGGTTDISVVSKEGVLLNKSIQIGVELIDEIIAKNLIKDHNFLIGKTTAEQLKNKAVTFFNPNEDLKFRIKGKDIKTRLPKVLEVSQKDICKDIKIPVIKIVEMICEIIKNVSPDVLSNMKDEGIILTGGASLLLGFRELIEKKTNINVKTVEDPISCAAYGALNSYKFLNNDFSQFILPA